MICPCCGSEVDSVAANGLLELELSLMERSTLRELLAVFPRGMTAEAITDGIYSTGGPEWADGNIKVFVHRLRKKLAGTGWEIRSRKRTSFYRLARVQDEAA